MFTRTLVVLTVLVLGLGTDIVGASAAQCEFTQTDAEAMAVAYDRLVTAGILVGPPPDHTTMVDPPMGSPFPTVTRGDFSGLLVLTLGLEVAAENYQGPLPLEDVQGHWARGYVGVLWSEGIIKGHEDGTFRPDATITLPEVKLMLARMLRLAPDLVSQPVDSLLLASGVNPLVPCQENGVTRRGHVYLLVDRAMAVPMYSRHPTTE